ncbi:cell division protein FtsW [Alkalithermobacter thermoalcaliphilus JW-YL-7 = DSM 7308]|uniref:Probable peptidoglycan glycosyltransferase FtsW n=1 Tax=Alkalithermobacter thermoalcaliphilus JW-YL-7 = DSM 7308 TaxID=1121328 RepID=A0A150FPK2_CLOPD|nr:stage V sporulation protein E [[Clostridium] paradoxum JW-YL-7 = DSM 7308]SHK98505.1 cell division protein FtsW [[Clostridium] paradoxum JW-YL-7 = DSM 7308]
MGKKKQRDFDPYIFYTTIALVVIGIIMVFSSSFVQAKMKMKDEYFFLKRNMIWATLGFFAMIFASKVDYKRLEKLTGKIGILTFILLVLVLTPLGININGARRWIGIGSLTIMPSEVAKFASIIVVSKIIKNKKNKIGKLIEGVFPCILVSSVYFALIMLQPDLSTGASILMTTIVMLFVAGLDMKVIIGLGGVACAAFVALIATSSYRLKRFLSFLDPFQDPTGSGYQVIQSLYALGSGGLFGLGLGRSRQKFFYIPEPQNDFIFAIIGEELGYIGCIVVLLLFLFLIYRCVRVAINAPDIYGSMLVVGITAQIGIQVMINVAVATSSMPVTGIPLPFISYGGSSLIIFMAAIGVILNVSRHVKLDGS